MIVMMMQDNCLGEVTVLLMKMQSLDMIIPTHTFIRLHKGVPFQVLL